MKKILLFFLAAMLLTLPAAGLYAQNAFFATKKGMALTYRNQDAKEKTTGYSVMTIKDIKGSGKNMSITYGMQALDSNRKPLKNMPDEKILKVEVKNDVVIFDLNQLIPAELAQQGVKMEVTGEQMELPGNLQAGQKIKDSNVTMKIDMGIMKVDTVVKLTGGQCLAIENVTVPAGTFKCHKITQTVTTTVMGVNTVTRTVSWYAPGIGTVKTEEYDKADKLSSSTVLFEKKGD
jgi:hypothetical protein